MRGGRKRRISRFLGYHCPSPTCRVAFSPMPIQPGTRLGPFEVTALLGAGGMGEVFRARDTRLGRDVAIKVLPQHLSAQPEVRARFEREAKTVSGLNHPNIYVLVPPKTRQAVSIEVVTAFNELVSRK